MGVETLASYGVSGGMGGNTLFYGLPTDEYTLPRALNSGTGLGTQRDLFMKEAFMSR